MRQYKLSLLGILLLSMHVAFAKPIVIERFQTRSGVTVLFHKAPQVPMVNIALAFHAGSAYDDTHPGISALTAALLNQGSTTQNAQTISEKLANTGASYQHAVTRDMAIFELQTLTEPLALQEAVQLFREILSKPLFSYASISHEKQQQLTQLKLEENSPSEIANRIFFETLYQKHPYAHNVYGSPQSIQSITQRDIQQFYRRYFVQDNVIIAMSGAINSEKAHEIAETLTESLLKGEKASPIPQALPLEKAVTQTVAYPSEQTALRLGQTAIDYHDPRFFDLLVGNHILGGASLLSRLSATLRQGEGLTYGVYSQFLPLLGKGPFIISLSTNGKERERALSLITSTLERFLNEGPEEAELLDAKRYLTGHFFLSLAGNSEMTHIMLKMAFYELPEDFLNTYVINIQSVTSEQIKKAFQDISNHLVRVEVGGQNALSRT